MKTALDGGIAYFDTAPFYGHGLSEHRLGEAMRGQDRDKAIISTRSGASSAIPQSARTLGPFSSTLPFDIVFDYSYGRRHAIDRGQPPAHGSGADRHRIIHDVTHKWRGDDFENSYRTAVGGAYRALDKLRSEGVIGAVGVGVNEPDTLERFCAATQISTALCSPVATPCSIQGPCRGFYRSA